MKIVIAPDSFKESLSAEKCCQAIKAGFSTIFPDAHYICLPIADGGEGTVDAMVAATGGNIVTLEVCGPMGETVNAFYGLTGDGKTAVIEMAAASGLMLVAPEKRNPLLASSFGTGELIRHALDNGIRHIILGIGGSATVDGGMGMAQALGVRFLDADGQVLAANGGNLARVASIEMDECDPRLANCHIEVACDVDNPLVGARGAAAVFGPQKGATPEMVEELEQGLQNYARVLQQLTEINVCQMAGGGAARNSMRYAVDYAAMNDHRLWHKGFASGVSRLNSHSVIVCYVLRRLRILKRLPLHGCNARRKPGFSGHWHWRQAISCLLNYASFVTVFRPRSMALRPTGGTGWVKAPD